MSTLPISIIIPAKNEVENLPRLLESLAAQSAQPLEVILADAGSTDGTREMAERSGVIVVPGGLPGVGRNRGAAVAKGEVYLFLDADVILLDPNFLAKAYTQFTVRGLAVASVDIAPLGGNWLDRLFHNLYNWYVRAVAMFSAHTAGACLMVRADIFRRVRGFDERMHFCEDMDFGRRAARHGKFAFLHGLRFYTGLRRIENDGYWKTFIRSVRAEWYLMRHHSIADGGFDYDFDYQQRGGRASSTTTSAEK